jgi:hypothetical protein
MLALIKGILTAPGRHGHAASPGHTFRPIQATRRWNLVVV